MEAGSFSSGDLTPLQVVVGGGVLQETDEDVPIEIDVAAIGLNNADFDWVLSNPIWGSAEFVFDEDRFMQEDRVIRYSPNPNYNGYDSFVVAVYDNLGHSLETPISVLTVHQNDPPQNTIPPVIAGDFMVGETVSCDPGEWNDDVDNEYVWYPDPESIITISFQWQRSIDREWEDIVSATEETYLLQQEDAEHNIRCLVIAEDDGVGMGDDNTTILPSNEEYCEPQVGSDDSIIMATSLISVYPNPFNPKTEIEFNLSQSSTIEIRIVNIKGKLVKILKQGILDSGQYAVEWTGHDQYDRKCSSGLYFCVLQANNIVDTKKIILLK